MARANVIVAVQGVALAAMKTAGKRQQPCSRIGRPTRCRVRKQVEHIYGHPREQSNVAIVHAEQPLYHIDMVP